MHEPLSIHRCANERMRLPVILSAVLRLASLTPRAPGRNAAPGDTSDARHARNGKVAGPERTEARSSVRGVRRRTSPLLH